MNQEIAMNQTKMTVKIYEPLFKSFDDQMNRLCIKRDAFLNHMIKRETPNLAKELDGRRLSSSARRYISGSLKRMGTRTVNVVVDKETADALNAVVDASNIVRDAFINRLIMFLRSADTVLDYFGMPKFIVPSDFDDWYEPMPTSPIKAMEAVFMDPLYYLRIAAEERFDRGLYLLDMPEKFVGLSCYLDDSSVPGTKEYEEFMELGELMLKALDNSENDAFGQGASATSPAKES